MRKITDKEELESITGGVRKPDKDIKNWITELSLALTHYIGYVRTNGVYKVLEQPYSIKTVSDNQNKDNKQTYIVIDDVIDTYSESNYDKYHLHIEKEINNKTNANHLSASQMSLYLDSTKLNYEITRLKEKGFKIKLYEDENNTKCLVAIKGGNLIHNIEKDFIELECGDLETAKDFASKTNLWNNFIQSSIKQNK
ncbi:hypothetical protein [Staphylococcus equorum]|uniref:Uncharacterized protein n=1 Tax=Staphylococcus equorum TaxID=246432 RepID=A0AAP7IG34_9STAP|nr:hypothetical protein [Staphylococcus equorum]OEK58916.1 hypothetical protein ASS94_00915 [Staphylococcus equorum]